MDKSCEAASADAFLDGACEGRNATITLNRPARRIGLAPGLPRARAYFLPSFRSHSTQMKGGLFPGQEGAGPADTVAPVRDVASGAEVPAGRALMYRGTGGGVETVARAACSGGGDSTLIGASSEEPGGAAGEWGSYSGGCDA